ncbi:MAG TPA: 3-oxoacyl-[acyl-carrier-protein] synthase III C-terminal domain-containing protein [Polyangiaceae bacterium]|jgi:predicted naringenin-chalcone synthase|nr:3-oxoacyl-[acyl-carrier-protein] synthase III C-terminal domain-containing protein [Polyangiaceae bacterium]
MTGNSRPAPLVLTRFSMRRPPHRIEQRRALDWLAQAHAESRATAERSDGESGKGPGASERDAFAARLRKVIDRCACGPAKIGSRGHVIPDVGRTDWGELPIYDVSRNPHGQGTAARTQFFAKTVDAYFEAEYEHDDRPPGDIVHVTCTGYVSPSGGQKLVQKRGWGDVTRVTHAYHMGCYAAFPAVRIAAGCLSIPRAALGSAAEDRRVDVVHTELCSLHLAPGDHSVEQLVIQSLFADGFIRYALVDEERASGLRVLALDERVLPDSSGSMRWVVSDWGMQMTLSPDVPRQVAAHLRPFVSDLYAKAGMSPAQDHARAVYAVHPGGPKIIDGVREVLELSEAQVQTSRDVLFDHGNMSSATAPHIWMRLVDDPGVAPGTPIVSLAFGPGLTVCGGIFRKQ